MYFLTTYTQDSELQAITVLSLTYTLYKSPQHELSLVQTFTVILSRCLVAALSSGGSSAYVLTLLPAG
jgi:hypothetical protein